MHGYYPKFLFLLEQRKLNFTRSESSLMFTHSQSQTVYICVSNGSANYFKISEAGYNLTNLEPDTMYTVDCMAHCEALDSNLEVKISAKTCKEHTHMYVTYTSPPLSCLNTYSGSNLPNAVTIVTDLPWLLYTGGCLTRFLIIIHYEYAMNINEM